MPSSLALALIIGLSGASSAAQANPTATPPQGLPAFGASSTSTQAPLPGTAVTQPAAGSAESLIDSPSAQAKRQEAIARLRPYLKVSRQPITAATCAAKAAAAHRAGALQTFAANGQGRAVLIPLLYDMVQRTEVDDRRAPAACAGAVSLVTVGFSSPLFKSPNAQVRSDYVFALTLVGWSQMELENNRSQPRPTPTSLDPLGALTPVPSPVPAAAAAIR